MQKDLKNAVVAITGAGSGIGRALALYCADAGATLAISDLNAESLAETAQACELKGATVSQRKVDVAQRAQVYAWADVIAEEFGAINVIVNNAGVNLGASVEASSIEDYEWVMAVDFWSVVYGCKAFLPHLRKAQWAHIINISSLFGLIGMPNQSAYNAAKFAVKGFTDSLRMEMLSEGNNIGVSSVHPGGVKTNIVNSAKFGQQIGSTLSDEERKATFNEKLAKTTPERAAEIIMDGMQRDKSRILVGNDARLFDFIQRLMPQRYQKIALSMTSSDK
jgi:NAD(P)-dependent dehydrogenase (short-subunit alcohol dehydrogenase family)